MHHQPLELEYLRVMDVDFGHGRNVVRLSVDATDNTEVIHSLKFSVSKKSINDLFFQWNKTYVLDTAQGPLIKRIRRGSDNEHILIVSDNTEYEPFELSKSQFHGVALVRGLFRLE